MWWFGFAVVVVLFGVALYARWRMRRDQPRYIYDWKTDPVPEEIARRQEEVYRKLTGHQ